MKAGYQGKDSMRANAEKAFGNSLKGVTAPAKMSMSAADKIPPRPYKKGGAVKKNMGGAMGAQALPQDPSKKQMGFKKGGKAVKKQMGGATARPFSPSSAAAALKKGGKAKKCNLGGPMPSLGDLLSPSASAQPAPRNRLVGPGPIPDLGRMNSGMKKGGKTKKMAMGGVGKIRHKEMTKAGKPMKTGRKKVV